MKWIKSCHRCGKIRSRSTKVKNECTLDHSYVPSRVFQSSVWLLQRYQIDKRNRDINRQLSCERSKYCYYCRIFHHYKTQILISVFPRVMWKVLLAFCSEFSKLLFTTQTDEEAPKLDFNQYTYIIRREKWADVDYKHIYVPIYLCMSLYSTYRVCLTSIFVSF